MKVIIRIPVWEISKRNFRYISFALDLILFTFAFFLVLFLRKGTLRPSSLEIDLLFICYLSWLIVSIVIKKFDLDNYKDFYLGILLFLKSLIFSAYAISFIVVIFGLSRFSRMHIFGTCGLLFLMEVAIFSMIYFRTKDKSDYFQKINFEIFRKFRVSASLLIVDFLLISAAYYIMNFFKGYSFILSSEKEKILILLYGLWLIVSFITQKFSAGNFQNYYFALAACLKSIVIMALSTSVIIFTFRLFYLSRLQIFGTLLLLFIFEAGLYYFYFAFKFSKELDGDIESITEQKKFYDQKKLHIYQAEHLSNNVSSFMKMLSKSYLRSSHEIFEFVDQAIDLSSINDEDITILSSSDISNIQVLQENSMRLLINLRRINDVRWINRYFLEIHKHMKNGGYLIGRAETIDIHQRRFFQKYPRGFANFLYLFDFIFFRAFPKIPKLRKIYFVLTKGRNRRISRAEVLGRLFFCGFNVLAEKEIGDNLYFVSQKVKTPSFDKNPSYSPLIKLRRVGINGNHIDVYKVRTMYPYSEYLQDYIYTHQSLDEGGKIMDDFRVTGWGKVFRKYWLDELPMLYNWIRGEIKLFGVRPLSKHYLNLYDSYLKRIRKKVKPGLIPPYYADMPQKIEEIIDSEKRYIQAYLKHPIKTQFVYFWKAFNNIVIKGVRSG